MKLRNKRIVKTLTNIAKPIFFAWMSTVRKSADSQGQLTAPWDPKVKERFIYSIWHENMLVIATVKSAAPVTALVSQHRDGEIIADLSNFYGMKCIRGSSTRGGTDAVEEIIRIRETSHLILLPDGPRGPRRQVKRGLVYLSSWTQMPIVPMGIGFTNAWRLPSWDRMALPKPFSRLTVLAGPVIRVPPGAGKAALDHYHRLVQQSMEEAARAAESWAAGQKVAPNWPLPLERPGRPPADRAA